MRLAPLLLLLSVPTAFALDPSRTISQYGHKSWTVQEGVLPGAPTVVAQTADGYLWVGTRTGLVRFDGVRFVPFLPPQGEELHSSRILSMRGTSDASLWIGTSAGLERWYRGHLQYYPDTRAWIMSVLEDRTGKTWFTRMSIKDNKGPLCEVVGDRAVCHGVADGVPIDIARDLSIDAQGNLWTVSDTTLMRWQSGSARTWLPPGLSQPLLPDLEDVVQSVALAHDGTVWVGALQPSRGLGLLRLDGDKLVSVVTSELDGRKLSVAALMFDRQNNLWIGTQDEGVYRLSKGRVSHYRRADGLSSDTVQSLFEDREGTMWVVTTQGIDAFRDLRVASVSSREGLSADLANAVLAARDGTVWIDTWHSLDAWRDGKVTSLNARNGLPGAEVTALFEDPDGVLWVGIDRGLAVFEEQRFKFIRQADSSPIGLVESITADAAGDVWVVTALPTALSHIRDGKIIERTSENRLAMGAIVADPSEGIWLPLKNGDLGRYRRGQLEVFELHRPTGNITGLVAFSDGVIVGSSTLGLIGWRAGKTQTMTAENGLPCVNLHMLLKDRHGGLWLYAACGVIFVAADQLQAWWQNPRAALRFRVFDAADGAQPARANFFPKGSTGPDGQLWFANASVVQVLDPNHLGGNTLPPPVQIERLIADRKSFPLGENMRLPPNSRDLQIDYTGLSFVFPRKTAFRYRLVGHDTEWQDVGTRRQAFYTDLPPRDYVFQVTASNNDGVWNPTGARLAFSIAPTFYQTRTFAVLCVLAALGIVSLLFLLRLRQIESRMRVRLEERIGERERIARELHDTLLQGVQGLMFRLHAVRELLPGRPEEAAQALKGALQCGDQAIAEGRAAVQDLRATTLAPGDLAEALLALGPELLPEGVAQQPSYHVLVEGKPRPLMPLVRDESYRIAREAVRNAIQHARARRIEVELVYGEKSFCLRIRDDGVGVDARVLEASRRGGHWGIPGMHERAKSFGAHLEMWSEHGAGTELLLEIPATTAYGRGTARATAATRHPE